MCGDHSNFIVCPHQLRSQNNFWNRLIFLNKHRILSRGLNEAFWGNFEQISDCRALSLFETVPGCRAYSHSVLLKLYISEYLKSISLKLNGGTGES